MNKPTVTMFSKVLLRQLANTTSYSRGESYFDSGSVRKVKRDGNTFTGKVDGSQRYTVSLKLTTVGPEFHCSCPYYYDGLCKHSVAFGLAVLDEYGPTIELPSSGIVMGTQWFTPEANSGKTDDMIDVWQRVSDGKKLEFLRQLLAKQPELQTQLALFAGVTTPMPIGERDKTLSADAICSAVCEQLSDLRFDEDTLEFDHDDWYSEDSPDPTPLIADVLQPYAEKVALALREGRLTDAMTLYMGVYEGTQAATQPDHDEFGTIGDYPNETLAVWHELLQTIYTEMALRVFSTDQLREALQQLADRIRLFEELEDEEDTEDENYTEPLYSYNLKAFEPLLMALVTEATSAQVMQEAITQYSWQGFGTEYLQLHIADKRHDPAAWLKIAVKSAQADLAIGLQLLERLRQAGDKPALLTQLHRLSKPFSGQLDAFILEQLSVTDLEPGPDRKLYLNALANRCRRLGQLTDYQILRTYLSPAERRTFANGLTNQYGTIGLPLFYAQVLHMENRTDELLTWLGKTSWQNTRAMGDVLALAALAHPDDCLALTRKNAFNCLETGKRDRGMYNVIAEWIAGLNSVPTLRTQAATLAANLVSANPRLSALRDELRLKGLVR